MRLAASVPRSGVNTSFVGDLDLQQRNLDHELQSLPLRKEWPAISPRARRWRVDVVEDPVQLHELVHSRNARARPL